MSHSFTCMVEGTSLLSQFMILSLISKQKHTTLFPTLARMAQDFLVIPAMSVSVERTFSKS